MFQAFVWTYLDSYTMKGSLGQNYLCIESITKIIVYLNKKGKKCLGNDKKCWKKTFGNAR